MIRFNVKKELINTKLLQVPCSRAESVLANQALKDTDRYVPMLTGSLKQRAHVQGNMLIYPGPYARYLYEGKAMVNAATGKGPMLIPDVGYRWPKGAKLRASDKDLVFTHDFHPDAQARWFEVSKAQYIKKWERVTEKAVKDNL